ncbi:uncharacterized protein LOC131429290 [Malaya genurostris]|uniref:uncharacterized protein LOC131429290 n=1 Tax=Malaya genurostris TaxID=325434 RepID=UPI0026F39336|nr:uncharacterized protein LOC131429290 [Malaya genurostris]
MESASTSFERNVPPDNPPGNRQTNANERTIPEWMDRSGMHGQRIILQLRAAGEKPLPKNPFTIGKSIETICGGNIESAHTEERGTKYVLKTRSAEQAKKLIRMNKLIDGTDVIVESHPTLNKTRCVLSCREAMDLPTEEIKQELEHLGVLEVRRITRRKENDRVNTPTLVLTFQGTTFPKYIKIGPLRVETREFIPNPMLCFNCCSYGHTKVKCPNNAVCQNCSGDHKLEKDACKEAPYCKNCKGGHSPTSRKCPQYVKEEKVIKIKTEKGISFSEARKEYSKQHGEHSYAAICGAQNRLENMRKDDEIKLLKEEIQKLKNAERDIEKDIVIKNLREEIEQMRTILADFNMMKVELEKLKKSKNIEYPEISEDEHDQAMSEGSDYTEENEKERSSATTKRKIDATDSETDPRGSADEKSAEINSKTAKDRPPARKGRGRPRKH